MGVLTLRVVANIHPGQERDYQEDNFIIGIDPTREDWNVIKTEQYSPNEWGSMLVLADGMGGLNAGEVASQKAVDGYKEYILQRRGSAPPYAHAQALLVDAILHANKKILDYAVDNPETKGMGTTIVAAWIVQDMMHLAWSGDSRCYIYNSGHLRQINSDHSYVQELVNKKEISPEDAFYHPKKNIITQSLGDVGLAPSPEYRSEKLRDGDRILLCSDGLNSMLMDEQIEAYMAGSDIRDCANQLVDAANRAGGFDNITVLLAEVLSVGDAAVIPEPLEQIGGNGGSVVPSPSGKTLINFKLTKKTAKSIFLALLVLALGAIVWFSIKNFALDIPINNQLSVQDSLGAPQNAPPISLKKDTATNLIKNFEKELEEKGKDKNNGKDKGDDNKKGRGSDNPAHVHVDPQPQIDPTKLLVAYIDEAQSVVKQSSGPESYYLSRMKDDPTNVDHVCKYINLLINANNPKAAVQSLIRYASENICKGKINPGPQGNNIEKMGDVREALEKKKGQVNWGVLIGSFGPIENAQKSRDVLKLDGYPTKIIRKDNKGRYCLVIECPACMNEKEAKDKVKRLKAHKNGAKQSEKIAWNNRTKDWTIFSYKQSDVVE